jgi:hypothetical protein
LSVANEELKIKNCGAAHAANEIIAHSAIPKFFILHFSFLIRKLSVTIRGGVFERG